MSFSIRLTDQERELADSYAKLHSLSLAEAFKKAFFEKIEDEYDIVIAEEAEKEFNENGKKTIPAEEYFKQLDLL